jgi:hypothetical protein
MCGAIKFNEVNHVRLWSIHPSLLDQRGLIALWREALLAQKVLRGQTRGYRFHPQLNRFRKCGSPVRAISTYLWAIYEEASRRGYSFDAAKIASKPAPLSIPVTQGQLAFEWVHLKAKLRVRDKERFRKACQVKRVLSHPLFTLIPGETESWERPGNVRKQRK